MVLRNRTLLVGIATLTLITALAAMDLAQRLGWSDGVPGSVEAAVSMWGTGDEAGASNWITPQKVMDAVALITMGNIYELGRVYEAGMPLFGTRTFKLTIPGSPTGGPLGANNLIFHDELLTAEIGQVGTQFDGLGHIGKAKGGTSSNKKQMVYYNNFTEADLMGPGETAPNGLNKLGVEKIKPIFTQGFLLDIARAREVAMLSAGDEITLDDVTNALNLQGINENAIDPGDAVLFYTGWGNLWNVDNDLYNSGEPGIGLAVADWLIDKQVAVVGADTWGVEVVPNPDDTVAFPVHQKLLKDNGIFLQENLDLKGLVDDGVYKFAYIFVRVPFKGGTGSPGSPIAVN